MKPLHVGLLTLALIGWMLTAPRADFSAESHPASAGEAVRAVPLPTLPAVAEHHYRVGGRIRPLLFFWMGKDNVGDGRITWRRDADGAFGYELLAGSDPDRAPRRMNRWGYIVERVSPDEATLLGVMSKSDEESLDEAETNVTEQAGSSQHLFKAIYSTIAGGEAVARVITVGVGEDITYREVAALLDRVRAEDPGGKIRRLSVAPDVEPGFLVAVAELVHRSVATVREMPGRARPKHATVAYVYNAAFHDLTLREAKFLREAQIKDRRYAGVIRAEFETRKRSNGETTKFELTYGTDGPLAEIPVHIRYRPRWWLELELVLDDAASEL